MDKPEWLYSWNWTEFDERRLKNAANDLDSLANELSSLARSCCTQGTNGLSSNLITDAGAHFEDELTLWKQKIESDVVTKLRQSATAIRKTIEERRTLWDKFQEETAKYVEWSKSQTAKLVQALKLD